MARLITETVHGRSMPDVWIEVGGVEYHGELRAWAVDQDPGTNQGDEWWAMCTWHRSHGESRIEWFPASSVRPVADLNKEDDRVSSNVVLLPQRET